MKISIDNGHKFYILFDYIDLKYNNNYITYDSNDNPIISIRSTPVVRAFTNIAEIKKYMNDLKNDILNRVKTDKEQYKQILDEYIFVKEFNYKNEGRRL